MYIACNRIPLTTDNGLHLLARAGDATATRLGDFSKCLRSNTISQSLMFR